MAKPATTDNPFDPICGKRLAGAIAHSTEYKKRRYFFCSERCHQAFRQHVERLRLDEMARAGALLSSGRVCWGLA